MLPKKSSSGDDNSNVDEDAAAADLLVGTNTAADGFDTVDDDVEQ